MFINITTLGYGFEAISYAHKYDKYVGIDKSENLIKTSNYSEYQAVQWIKENVDSKAVILQSVTSSSSYTTTGLISVFTGNPTVLGWSAHEWIWRANKDYTCPEIVNTRIEDVKEIYTGTNVDKVSKLLNKYDISYIYIGTKEYENYSNIDIKELQKYGETVYNQNGVYLIKVK